MTPEIPSPYRITHIRLMPDGITVIARIATDTQGIVPRAVTGFGATEDEAMRRAVECVGPGGKWTERKT